MANIFKQAGKSTKEMAKLAAKQVTYEKGEFVKAVKKQTVGNMNSEPSLMDQIITGDGKATKLTSAEEAEIRSNTNKRLEELEKELEQFRLQRQTKYEEWQKE